MLEEGVKLEGSICKKLQGRREIIEQKTGVVLVLFEEEVRSNSIIQWVWEWGRRGT